MSQGHGRNGSRFRIALVAARAIAGALTAPTLTAGQQDAPTFRGEVRLIDVDVVVTDQDGEPVRGLTSDDFEIIEEGRPQEIRTFSFIDLPFESPEALADRRARFVEPDVTTNVLPEGRSYVLLINTGPGDLRARHVAERWLDEVVQPGDRVAVVHARGSFKDAQTFTNSRRLILDSINRMVHVGTDTRPMSNRVLDLLHAMEEVSRNLGTVAGRRKAIVWLGGGELNLFPPQLDQGDDSPWAIMQLNMLAAVLPAWRDAARAAVDNNVAIYPVNPTGLTDALGPGILAANATLREVAEETGGVAIGVNSNSFGDGFATIVQDASVYYLLGYSPDRVHEDGKFHPIQVRVKRPGLTVRARRGYYAPMPEADRRDERERPTSVPEGVSEAAAAALRLPVPVKGLGVTVFSAPFKNAERNNAISVVIAAHLDGSQLSFEAGQSLGVAYQVFDVEGKVATGAYKLFDLDFDEASRQQAAAGGVRFVDHITLRPGRYELRLVAEQPGGLLGSVVTPLEALEFKGPLAMSGVVLTARGSGLEVPIHDDAADPALRLVQPTVARTFARTATLRAFAEIYTNRRPKPGDITLTASLARAPDDILVEREATTAATLNAKDDRRLAFEAEFALADLTPGDYVLTMEGRSASRPNEPITRQIPFTVRE